MNLLLDTHIWVWSLAEPAQLHARVRRALAASDAQIWLSPISLWEMRVLTERGRIQLAVDVQAWCEEALDAAPLREAPLTHAIVRALDEIETPHRDPADRFLAATAAALNLQLVTADQRLLTGKGYRVLSNL